MCGLFGYSGKKGKAANVYKLSILGLFNEARGTDSCGYYYNGNIERGIDTESKFSDFLSNHKLTPGNLKTKVFMGHTRKGTSGAKSLENAHPHVVENNYVQTHNGSLKDFWALARKHDLNTSKIFVDSVILAHLMVKIGIKETLDEYKGYAALAFTYMDTPESLFLYHGASKEYAAGVLTSERPLFTLDQPEGLYYSSTKESLKAISSTDDEPVELLHNAVYQIVDGEFTGKKILINRTENNVYSFYNTNSNKPTKQLPLWTGKPKLPESNKHDIVTKEPIPISEPENRVIFFKGRYHVMSLMHQNAKRTYPALLHGKCVINRNRFLVKAPPALLSSKEQEYYFINGIMVDSKRTFDNCIKNGIMGHSETSFERLSWLSKYPIFQHNPAETVGIGKNLWFHKGKQVKTDTFSPKFSDFYYEIKYGRTKRIWTNIHPK